MAPCALIAVEAMRMYFDSHAHYDSRQFDSDRDGLLSALPLQGVECVIDPGCDGETSRKALEIAEKYDYVYAAVGWHPQEWESWTADSIGEIRALAAHPKAVAIGEIGLDYYWDKEHKALQEEMLRAQLELAIELDKPVVIHERDAHADCMAVTLEYPSLRGVYHCFSGSAQMARQLLSAGWYLGFDGPITYKNARRNLEALAVCPMDRILIETDSPYLTPEPMRGRRNDSSMLRYVVQKIAEVKSLSPEAVAAATAENARSLFGISY